MQRPTIDLPERFTHETRLRVRIADVNYGGHLGNDALLTLLHEARLEWLGSMGFSETAIGEPPTPDRSGVAHRSPVTDHRSPSPSPPAPGLIMTDAVLLYRGQAFHGDELVVRTALQSLARTGFRLVHQVVHAKTDREIARAAIGLAFFDYAADRPARMPNVFRRKTGPDERRK